MEKKDLYEIPQFNSEDEEAAFWLEHDFTDYYDSSKWLKAKFPNLRPSTQSVTIHLPKFHRSKSFEDKLDTLIEKHRVTLEGLAER
jgi:hypothetical protein